jgi:hypothetical protein
MANKNKIDYNSLFEIWADFDDEKSPKEVKRLIEEHELSPMDTASFSGFCYGYYKAVQKINCFVLNLQRRKKNAKESYRTNKRANSKT